MASKSAEEAKANNVEKMGEALGKQYSELWQQVAVLYVNWLEYVELFGTSPARIELLNQAAPMFFHRIQHDLWESTLLHICRLTDAPKVAGKDNLTIENIPALIDDEHIKEEVRQAVEMAVNEAKFARDWRNRYIAHLDLQLALKEPATPLADASRKQVKEVLEAIAKVLNIVAGHYDDSWTPFDMTARHNGSLVLLYVLEDGVKVREQRAERAKLGTLLPDDTPVRRL